MMNSIRRASKAYDSAVAPSAENMQNALLKLLGNEGPELSLPVNAGRATKMAASEEMLALLKALPAAAVVGGGLGMSELVTGDDSFANKGMDALGMGAGAYGINRGVNGLGGTTKAGMALRIAAGMGLGKLGSDATQGAMGGMF